MELHICREPGFDPRWHACRGCLVPSLNDPFTCGCGSTRFIELTQWNALICRLEADPESAPTTILCWACKRVYKQAPDWSWKLTTELTPKGPRGGRDLS
jgi:hypothetical protein